MELIAIYHRPESEYAYSLRMASSIFASGPRKKISNGLTVLHSWGSLVFRGSCEATKEMDKVTTDDPLIIGARSVMVRHTDPAPLLRTQRERRSCTEVWQPTPRRTWTLS